MSSTTQQQTASDRTWARLQATKDKHEAIIDFLYAFGPLLVALSEPVMAEKFSDEDNVPHVDYYTSVGAIYFTAYGANQRETMRTLRRAIGGKWDKRASGDTFSISQRWESPGGRSVYLTIQGSRDQVCQRVVTGTETVEVPEVAFQPARTETRETVEWVCGNLLED